MPQPLLLLIALLCAIAGTLMVCLPGSIPRIEELLNRRWGGRTLFSIRLGTPLERSAERVLNRPVRDRAVHWDGWVQRHPRAAGLGLLCLAALISASATLR